MPENLNAALWHELRGEFPSLRNWTYLDTAAFGQIPRRASEAIMRHLQRREETACADFVSWFDDLDGIRGLCAKLVNCSADDIAFVPNACTALATLVQGLHWEAGDQILTLEGEFPNHLYQSAAAERLGLEFRAVSWPRFFEAVNARTRLVLLSTVNYATGFRVPIEEVAAFLRERGVLLYVDGTQSVGALQFDVQRVRPAMLSVDAYKWLMSPNGAGFAYVDPELRRRLDPAVVGWRSDKGWRDVTSLNHGMPEFADSAQKYEGGMLPFPSIYAMGAVIEMMLELTTPVIEQRVLELANRARTMLADLGGEVNIDRSQIVTALLPGVAPLELIPLLKQHRILASVRHGRLRVSTHLYNSEEDLQALNQVLESLPTYARR